MRYVLIAQSLDLVTFAFAMLVASVPIEQEQNVIARTLYQSGGVTFALGFKILVMTVMVLLISRIPEDAGRKKRIPVLFLPVLLGLIGFAGNTAAILRLY